MMIIYHLMITKSNMCILMDMRKSCENDCSFSQLFIAVII